MKSIIFLHVATIGKYLEILKEIMDRIVSTKVYDKVNNIYIGVAGNGNVPLIDKKMEIVCRGNLEEYEFLTLSQIEKLSNSGTIANVLYLHTKGASGSNDCIDDWRRYMLYFLLDKFDICLRELQTHTSVGVDWRLEPSPHYSGNFWWSKTDYIKTLPEIKEISSPNCKPILTLRHNAEFWIGMSKEAKAKSLWDCGIDQTQRHLSRYLESNYIGKI